MSLNTIKLLEIEIASLRETLKEKEALLSSIKTKFQSTKCSYTDNFTTDEITRYSRQMIMSQVQTTGQLALKNSKVLVVGAGGLGCPASLYLVAAGIGQLHIIDYDNVELANLHRQILHYEDDISTPKSRSAAQKLNSINNNVVVVPIVAHAENTLLQQITSNKYDVVLDCTDNVPTRYLLNDICVLKNIPLVSGSALKMEGQLTVYHYNDGPCYRCLFPVPPPAFAVTNCGDGGVLGPVCGVIGVLQALEAIKIITKMEGVLSERLLVFDGEETVFRNVKIRKRSPKCDICGDNPTILAPINYEQFCGTPAHDKVVNINILDDLKSIRVVEINFQNKNNIIIDVRPPLEYNMCSLPNTINVPFTNIVSGKELEKLEDIINQSEGNKTTVFILCRRGNDSQRALKLLNDRYNGREINFQNIKGGLHSYSRLVDPSFPIY